MDASQPTQSSTESWLYDYAKNQSQSAFAKLVEAYGGLVYASALRRTASPQMAEEVSQDVFTLIAKKAAHLHQHPSFVGWLFVTTRRRAQEALRSERRNRDRLKRLETMTNDAAPTPNEGTTPWLDEALDQLKSGDRDILLWHYVEERSYEDISQKLGKTSVACRKRASRALEKLSAVLEKQGFAVPAVALGSALFAQLGEAAPAAVSSTLEKCATSSIASGTAASSTVILATMKLKSVLTTAVLAILPFAVPWVAGVSMSVGVMHLSGPAIHLGPESIVMDVAEHKATRAAKDHQAAVDAAYAKLFAQALSAKGSEENRRVMDAGLALYEAEPEGLCRMLERAPLSDAKKLFGMTNAANHGCIIAMETLERGYLISAPEAQQAGFYLISMAAREHPERFLRWLEQHANETDYASPYILPSLSPDYLETLPESSQDRYLKIYEQTLVSLSERQEPMGSSSLMSFLGSLRYAPPQVVDRLVRNLLPSIPMMTDDAFKNFTGYISGYLPNSTLITERLDPSTPRNKALIAATRTHALPTHENLLRIARAEDLASEINALVATQPTPDPKIFTRFDRRLANTLLGESANPAEVLEQLESVDPVWRDRLGARMISEWARYDVVAASAALAQASYVPDSAITALVREIAEDPEAARAWAGQIKDPALRGSAVTQMP